MMKKKVSKISKWVLALSFVLFASVSPQEIVAAQTLAEVAESSYNYSKYIAAVSWAQAAIACQSTMTRVGHGPENYTLSVNLSSSTSNMAANNTDRNGVASFFDSTLSGVYYAPGAIYRKTLYNSYLDAYTNPNNRGDSGDFWCSDSNEHIGDGNFITRAISVAGLDADAARRSFLCDSEVFSIQMGYYSNSNGLTAGAPGSAWTVPTGANATLTPTECTANYDLIKQAINGSAVFDKNDNGDFTIRLTVKRDNDAVNGLSNWFRRELGDWSNITSSDLMAASQVLNFEKACVSSSDYVSKSEYDAAQSRGESSYYYYIDSKLETKYYKLSSNSAVKNVYWDYQNLTSTNNSGTCKVLAEKLQTSSDSGAISDLLSDSREGYVHDCYDSYINKEKELENIPTYLERIRKEAVLLLGAAESMQNSEQMSLVFAASSYSTNMSTAYSSIKNSLSKAGASVTEMTAVTDFINLTKNFESEMVGYSSKLAGGGTWTDEDRQNLGEVISTYHDGMLVYRDDIQEPVDGIIQGLHSSIINENSMYENGSVKEKVDGFYDFASDPSTGNAAAQNSFCKAVSETLPLWAGRITNITGGSINFGNFTTGRVTSNNSEADYSVLDLNEACYSAGLDAMGWVVCPALSNLHYTATGLDSAVEDMLVYNTSLYDADSPTHTAWEMMRNISNALMIIVLLVIVFSQLTGYGIDNYGIKKMLPRLIVMAILVNLSFYACEILVDLSNIVGVGLRDLFHVMGDGVGANAHGFGATMTGILTAIFTGAGLLGAGSGVILMIGTVAFSKNPVMIVLVVLLALVMIVVAIAFFFVMLGARLAIVVMCMVLAPVAAVLYILPNTQSIAKKWWDLFKAALIIYPICGAMSGIGFLIRKIAVAGEDLQFTLLIIGLILPYLIFFLLPTLLKAAIAATGKIGGALTAAGSFIRGGMAEGRRTMQLAPMYKTAQEQSRRNVTRWQAGLDKEYNPIPKEKIGRFRRIVSGGNRGMATNRQQAGIDLSTMAVESTIMDEAGFKANKINREKKAEEDSISAFETTINYDTRDGTMKEAVQGTFDQYMNQTMENGSVGNKSGAVAATRVAGNNKDTAAEFMKNKIKNPDATRRYNPQVFKDVTKEIATGKNSATFKKASPLGYQFASKFNSGETTAKDYKEWLTHKKQNVDGSYVMENGHYVYDNLDKAVNDRIDKPEDLRDVKEGALNEIIGFMNGTEIDGEMVQISAAERERIGNLAARTIRAAEHDSSSLGESHMAAVRSMAAWSTPAKPVADGGGAATPNTGGAGADNDAAQPGQILSTRQGGGSIVLPGSPEAQRPPIAGGVDQQFIQQVQQNSWPGIDDRRR